MSDAERLADIDNRLFSGKTITHDEVMWLIETGHVQTYGKIPASKPELAKAVKEAKRKWKLKCEATEGCQANAEEPIAKS